jgi:putative glycerol-1-phosphate prenyltransferase
MSFKKLVKNLIKAEKPLLAVLIDPDKFNLELIKLANTSKVACFLLGGSEIKKGSLSKTLIAIKKVSKIPVILFPGDEKQLSEKADGLFLPSLLSGRNADYLIEKHIAMAPLIQKMKLKHLPMAYLLVNGNKRSTTQKVTKTKPLDPKNLTYILNTCLAAEQLGFKLIYLEAGSGAKSEISGKLIQAVKGAIQVPLIVGGGIDSKEKALNVINAGANLVVVGNALEKDVHLLTVLSECF